MQESMKLFLLWKFKSFSGRNIECTKYAHLLIVKKVDYLYLSVTAINSFSAWNPDYKVIVHMDKALYSQIEFFKLKFNNIEKIQFIEDIEDSADWIKSQFELLISLNGTFDLAFDADMRCNSKIKLDPLPTNFIIEKQILGKLTLDYIALSFHSVHLYNHSLMLNPCVFSWGGNKLSQTQKIAIEELFEHLMKGNEPERSNTTFGFPRRLAGQIAFSIMIQEYFPNFKIMKANDKPRDGGVFDSTYFGASGNSFRFFRAFAGDETRLRNQ